MIDYNFLVTVFAQLSKMREEFINLGFSLSEIELQHIESVRTRTPNEKDVAFYKQERFLESLSFSGGRWRRSRRDVVGLAYRSAYIDFLCSRYPDRDSVFGADNSDAPEAYESAMQINVDPNYLLYSRLGLTNDALSRRNARENNVATTSEVEHFKDDLLLMVGSIKSFSEKGFKRIVSSAAHKCGFQFVGAGSRPRLLLEAPMHEDYSLILEWDDELVLRKWGKLQFVFSIRRAGDVLKNSEEFRCTLDDFIPGGGLYTKTNRDILRISLGVLAHLEFMKIIRSFAAGNPSRVSRTLPRYRGQAPNGE